MLLTIDVGNTNMVFGIFEEEELIATFRLTTAENRTSDEIGLMVRQYFTCFQIDPALIEAVMIATVVPHSMYALTKAIVRYIGKKPIIVDEDVFPSIRYEGDERLGADRSVCCEAAIEKYGAPLIVLDFGTATTIDAVSESRWYMGGCILTGLKTNAEALFHKAAKLPLISLDKPNTVLGCSTIEQIQVGIVSGYIGSMEHLVRETKKEMGYGDEVKVIATGGLAKLIAEHTDFITVVDSQLIMDGLRILYKKYKEQQG